MRDVATFRVKAGLAEMLKGGVIMDVVTPAQATVAEEAGAAAGGGAPAARYLNSGDGGRPSGGVSAHSAVVDE